MGTQQLAFPDQPTVQVPRWPGANANPLTASPRVDRHFITGDREHVVCGGSRSLDGLRSR